MWARHQGRKHPCKEVPTPQILPVAPTETPIPLKFIDLFCGIGGFHLALQGLATCVLACDIDEKCRQVYATNFGITPHQDITTLKTDDIPDFDILCGGFPCQAFSHAGSQAGFQDTRGTLFFDILRILKAKQPRYCLLENVKNLKGHDGGTTWRTIRTCLRDAGYTTYEDPIVLSPHNIGVPQHRERVFILATREPKTPSPPAFPTPIPAPTSIHDILLPNTEVPAYTHLDKEDAEVLTLWDEVVQHFGNTQTKLPGFPLWSDDWDSTYTLADLPDWKAKFVQQNRDFYEKHKEFLGPWLTEARASKAFRGAKRKFEWQAGATHPGDTLWECIFQFRPSGIRTKRPTYSPALVAMSQIAVLGSHRRKLAPREVARLQSFPDVFQIHSSPSVAYKQFGNSVNVKVVRTMAEWLLTL